jgi:hypothetical protein
MHTRTAHSADLRRLVVTGVFLACLAVTVQTALYVADVYALDRRVDLFDLDNEGGVATWAGSVAIFSTGFVVLLLALVESSRRLRLLALAAALTFFSLDDAVALHERLGLGTTRALDVSPMYVRVAWPALYLPLLVAVAALILQLARTSTGLVRRLLVVGLAALVGAVALEIAGLALDVIPDLKETAWLSTVHIVLEEGAELAGWILLTTGLAVRLLVESAAHPIARPANMIRPSPEP